MTSDRIIINIEDLGFDYASDDGEIAALDGVSLALPRGSFTAVIGRNGSGKSTLAKNINALLVPTRGRVTVGGFDTQDEDSIWEIRRLAGMVFQNPDNQLVSAVVEDDVAFGPENLGLPREEIRARVRASLESVDMYEQRKMAPHLLSGGQKQRIAIAGVVAMRPDVIIFDEPTAMLDPEGRGEVLDIAKRLHAEGITVLLITHFMEETVDADRLIIMDRGHVAMDGAPAEIFTRTEELRALGLRLPFAVDLSEALRARSLPIPEGQLHEEELARVLATPSFCAEGAESSADSYRQMDSAPAAQNDGFGAKKIIVENLTHTYNKGLAYETNALDDVSFEVAEGEFCAIIGHTGSGKSTLIQHLNGLLKPTSGTVVVGGVDVTAKGASVIDIRRKTGMVFQYPEYQLFEETVYLDVAFGPKNLGIPEDEIEVRVKEALALVNLDFNEFAHRSPFELSGGQKRMAAIAGVLAMRPEVLILDEPTAGLDPKSHEDVLALVVEIRRKTGCTVLLVSHNMDDVAALSDRVFVMAEGRIVKAGAPEEVFADEDFMKGIGLGVPRARAFASLLAREGLVLPEAERILTRARLLEALTS
jgi:energy-coupling factor transport system ATP-binding protein